MSRIIMVKVSYPKECGKCGRVMRIGEWAQALPGGELECSLCHAPEEK